MSMLGFFDNRLYVC